MPRCVCPCSWPSSKQSGGKQDPLTHDALRHTVCRSSRVMSGLPEFTGDVRYRRDAATNTATGRERCVLWWQEPGTGRLRRHVKRRDSRDQVVASRPFSFSNTRIPGRRQTALVTGPGPEWVGPGETGCDPVGPGGAGRTGQWRNVSVYRGVGRHQRPREGVGESKGTRGLENVPEVSGRCQKFWEAGTGGREGVTAIAVTSYSCYITVYSGWDVGALVFIYG